MPRILFGWGLASVTLWRLFSLGGDASVKVTVVYLGLIAFFVGMAHSTVTGIVLGNLMRWWSFFVGMAHSTVTGIVLGNLMRWWSFFKRGGKNRRNNGPPGLSSPELTATSLPKRRRSDSRKKPRER